MGHPINFYSFTLLLCSLSQIYICTASDHEVYYIRANSTPTDHCAAPCLLLSEFAGHYQTLHSNTTVIFLPGIHYLEINLSISNFVNYSIIPETTTAQIECRNYSHISFGYCQHVSISNLEFIGCGGNQVAYVNEFVVHSTRFFGYGDSGTALEITASAAQVINSTFKFNRGKLDKSTEESCGGAIYATGCMVNITQSTFENNEAIRGGAIFAWQFSIIIICNSSFIKNSAAIGGVLFSIQNSVTLKLSKLHSNTATSREGEDSPMNRGGVLYSLSSNITIERSKFDNNSVTSSMGSEGGVLFIAWDTTTIKSCIFDGNTATSRGSKYGSRGGVLYSWESIVTIERSKFVGNRVTSDSAGGGQGGVLCCMHDIDRDPVLPVFVISIVGSEFNSNTANSGGVLYSEWYNVTIVASIFYNNSAISNGGVMYSKHSFVALWYYNNSNIATPVTFSEYRIVTIVASKFYNNSATTDGGVLYFEDSCTTLVSCTFHNNFAKSRGGVMYLEATGITINSEIFNCLEDNEHKREILFSHNGTVMFETAADLENIASAYKRIFDNNSASLPDTTTCTIGWIEFLHLKYRYLNIVNNSAGSGVMYLIHSEMTTEKSVIMSNNVGSLMAFDSEIILMSCFKSVNNHPRPEQSNTTTGTLQEGGAITIFQSTVVFNGICDLSHNYAKNGGGLLSVGSKLDVLGLSIARNTAKESGGGVYLSNSELICEQSCNLLVNNNYAGHRGGGIHAISSSIKAEVLYNNKSSYLGGQLRFTENVADMGGGLSLEANAKLYIRKHYYITLNDEYSFNTIEFIGNYAHSYGGAVYVDDDTNSGACTSSSSTECFFQVLVIHEAHSPLRTHGMCFLQNQANISGSTLYGGLLDRCIVSQFAEVNLVDKKSVSNGVVYFKNAVTTTYCNINNGEERASIATNISISSGPVKVYLCLENEHHVEVMKGKAFNISVFAVDQVEQPVNAIIHASLKFPQSGLSEGQMKTEIQGECTNLTFNIVSPSKYEHLTLYASNGPCKDADISRKVIRVDFLPCTCPIGFQISGKIEINCTCDCHINISQYTKHCDSLTETFVKKFPSKSWISYINDTKIGYLVYQNCPFDYCDSLNLPINLNQPNGADAQCAFNRSSLLCGSCQPGLSLSLSTSHCLPCPSYWPVLLTTITLAAILAGIGLVAFLLLLNMTVAVGTLNGLIFYANIIHANKAILFPLQGTNIVTIFISLLNLELGVNTCYFPGVDAYIKIWLQLAFPTYVILLVVLVIVISHYSMMFSRLIGKKDPVATLAMLILLSYAKILEICFESLSVGILKYPDGSSKALWLPDATVQYLQGKHIPLLIVAVLILLAGLVYTAVLFIWQWRFYLPQWKIFIICLRSQKLQFFIETYHAPFTPKYRYWTGLLLIARAILYLVAAVNVSNDPQLALSAIVFTVSFILLIIAFTNLRMYKKMPINILETFFIVNLLLFSVFTWYSLSSADINQRAVAYTSVLSTLVMLMLIILYHIYTYTSIFSKIRKMNLSKIINRFRADLTRRARYNQRPSPEDSIHRFNELLNMTGPANTHDYNVPLLDRQPVEPTYSVVELPKPQHTNEPAPEEANIHVPGPDATATTESEAV